MKKGIALLAIAGMLTTPLAMAQGAVSTAPSDDKPASAVQATTPQSGGASGFAESLGISNTTLAVGAGVALAVAIGVAAGSGGGSGGSGGGSGGSGTTGTTGTN